MRPDTKVQRYVIKSVPTGIDSGTGMSLRHFSILFVGSLDFATSCDDSAADGATFRGGAGSVSQAGSAGTSGSAGMSSAGTSSSSAGSSAGTANGGSSGQGGSLTGGTAGQSGSPADGGAGAGAYNPCPSDGSACRLMPLGDSITAGIGSSDGSAYRRELFRHALSDSRALTFVGTQESGPAQVDGEDFPNHHEGHSGWTIDDGGGRDGLYPDVADWLQSNPPHIVTLQIGTNDVTIDLDLAQAPDRLGLLLDRIIDNAPDALIVVAEIVPTTDNTLDQRVQTYNAAIPGLVAERQALGAHQLLVDMYSAFTANTNYKTDYMDDFLHPSDAGYAVMADTWYEAIAELLPAAP